MASFTKSGLDIPPECDPVVAPVMDAKAYNLSTSQIKMANLIVERFVKAGFGYPVAAAAVANAFRESSFNPEKESEAKKGKAHGKFIGLFQLGPHILEGVEDRKDPRKNIDAMIAYASKRKAFINIARTETDIPTLAREFSLKVEAPEDAYCEADIRETIANKLFPLDFSENDPDALTPAVPEESLQEEAGYTLTEKVVLGTLVTLLAGVCAAVYLRVAHNIPPKPPELR